MLINLSNSPQSLWGESQRQAAGLTTCDGQVVDLAVVVPVHLTKTEVRSLAQDISKRVQEIVLNDKGGTAILVNIEPTFDFIFIKKMQARGYLCVTPVFTSIGTFIKFREY